jgi:hypothetical protein
MPLKGGTIAEGRTQLDLKCGDCGHQWFIEMSPPVLIVKPDRQTDVATSPTERPPIDEQGQAPGSSPEISKIDDRRHPAEMHPQRMRIGLCGLLTSTDGTHTVAVLYSLDADRATGRLRLLDPGHPFPPWLGPDTGLRLSGYDGVPLHISVTAVKLPRDVPKDDDHFAEFVVRRIGGHST